ncbi:ammonium transporter [Prochlorococcus marinus str. XMU1401]|jgi:Amt family ammonium transporter|uniref:Ammonium transporter n=3 Tax=Prochlorococcus marinus TaxID=1219 RepID=A2BP62_PROMS|nr:ammonium transporter [Prochlorococcus marinus]MCQ9198213.1 ammonium transporter [Prochlorococcus marinus XMU1429]MCQ9202594.1 ammonium transporter [Prochlorococcus marinus XMU1425]MCR8534918.1 ammonium transporter [Prochlorococcus marinus XMU1426]MDA9692012.1 ammonium transporter [Prochlorococcus sp. AH-736-N03]MDC2962542.1 ammonium transporter [Prochlorococcus sp. AH-736-K15]MDC2988191.1 ammonium transporter [Prochlorococcus sp. AH-736-J10]MDC3027445.1 ammonium transporter [bacterium]MD
MTTALQTPQRRSRSRLQDASLVNGPMLLLRSIRGFSSNRSMLWLATVPLALFGLGIFNLSAHAADLPELNAAFLANNLWLLIATILVIFMNAGFAMVEAGMCRSKNAVNILAKNLFVFALAVTSYWFIGYSLMYGGSVADGWLYFGGLFFDPTVTADMVTDAGLVPTVDFLFQSAFAGTAATIVSGLVAERVKFGEFVVFAVVLTAFIYPIAGSWKWNGGWLDSLGFVDFAGSSIVHSVGAWAGLVGAMLLGPRIGKYSDGKPQAMPGHNMAIATLGALVLWIGWYGFNPGSQLAMDQWVPYVAVTTTLAAAAGAIGATIVSTLTSGKPDLTMIINGILAGLVSITAGCGDMTLAGAWFAGLVGGIIVVFSVAALDAAEIDDPVGAFSVHGVCGVWGTVVIGLWGTAVQGDGAGMGLFNGGGITLLLVQALGAAAYAIWTLVTCWIAWSVIGGLFGGIRVSEEEETQGLDIGEHGMEAYPDFASAK